jgi:putative FmdB family regulatory protein
MSPLFDYQCRKCNRVFEKLVRRVDEDVFCCHEWAERLMGKPARFIIRGYNAGNGYSIPKESDFDDSNVPSTSAERTKWEREGRIPTPDQYTRG